VPEGPYRSGRQMPMKSLPGPPSPRPRLRPRPLVARKLKPRAPRPGTFRPAVPVPQAFTASAPVPIPEVLPALRPAACLDAPPLPTFALPSSTNALVLRGDYWEVTYEGRSGIIENCRGLQYIAILVEDAAAGRGPVHAKELVARASGAAAVPTELERKDVLLDATARHQLMSRLEELAEQRDRACARGDLETAAALDAEHERITEELSRAAARGGRRRAAFTDAGEKARKAVSKAISEAVARISSHPDLTTLALHLSSAIRKGQWLSYAGGLAWRVDAPLPRG
jgi:hypothetical protein